jgi:precorrin-2 dehydrogenase/sirohydrochlorin ferrochelatase
MIPILLDGARLDIALFGDGERAVRRLALLREGGAAKLRVFSATPSGALSAAAGDALEIADPEAVDLGPFAVVYAADLAADAAERLAARARAAGKLVNVEDVKAQCDFHTPAVVRRGALTIGVSTDGLCPGLSGVLAAYLGRLFGSVWSIRLGLLEAKRRTWRARGLAHGEIRDALGVELERNGWLPGIADAQAPAHPSGATEFRHG